MKANDMKQHLHMPVCVNLRSDEENTSSAQQAKAKRPALDTRRPFGAVEIEKWRRVLRTTYLSFALRSCAPKCVKKMPWKPGDDQKS